VAQPGSTFDTVEPVTTRLLMRASNVPELPRLTEHAWQREYVEEWASGNGATRVGRTYTLSRRFQGFRNDLRPGVLLPTPNASGFQIDEPSDLDADSFVAHAAAILFCDLEPIP